MHIIRRENLPFIGSSYRFAGAEHGDVAISMFLVEAQPGRGAPLHSRDYDEVALVLRQPACGESGECTSRHGCSLSYSNTAGRDC